MTDNPYAVSSNAPKKRNEIVERPVTATIMGIINAIFGCMGLLVSSSALIYSLFGGSINPSGPGIPKVFQTTAWNTMTTVNYALSIPLCILLLTSAVGLLRFKMWGRKLALIWASLTTLTVLVFTTIMILLIAQPFADAMSSMSPRNPQYAGMIGGAVGGAIGTCSGLVYPIILAIFMNRRNFVASLRFTEEQAAKAEKRDDLTN